MSHPRPQRPERLPRYDPEFSDYRGRRQLLDDQEPGPVGQRLTAVALALVVLIFLGAYGLYTVTGRAAADRIYARAIPSMTELDRLVALHGAELQTQAQSAAPNTALTLAGLPIHVSVTADEVRTHTLDGVAQLLEQRAAAAIYDEGAGAFAAPGGVATNATGPLFSATWTVNKAFSLLNARQHKRLSTAALVTGVLALALALAFCLQVGSYGRIVGVGVAALVGALVAGVLTFCLWFVVQVYSSGASAPLAVAAWGMIADVSWIMLLIDGVAAITAAALLALGLIFAALARGPAPRTASEQAARFAPQIGRERHSWDE